MPDQTVRRDALDRSVPFALRDGAEDGDGLTIDGIAAVYDTPTRIDSWEGCFDEQIAHGAFGRSIRARLPRMQYDHGRHPMIGTIPIGRWDSAVEEPGVGLHVVGRMHDNWLIEPVRQAIAEQSVDGMSIRMTVVREEWRDAAGKVVRDPKEIAELLWNPGDRGPLQRTIREAKIAEAGPVCWPAYATTSVGVRSTVTIDLARLHTDPEQRRLLAHAVLLADTATSTTDGPRSTDPSPANHPPAEGGPGGTDGTPGEHPSAPPQPAKPNPARAFAARTRGYLLSIERN